jgi:hypothetical protein
MHAASPERLIGEEGNYYRRHAAPQTGCGGSSAAVMYDGGHLWEEPVVRHRADRQHVVRKIAVTQSTPTGMQYAAHPCACQSVDNQLR